MSSQSTAALLLQVNVLLQQDWSKRRELIFDETFALEISLLRAEEGTVIKEVNPKFLHVEDCCRSVAVLCQSRFVRLILRLCHFATFLTVPLGQPATTDGAYCVKRHETSRNVTVFWKVDQLFSFSKTQLLEVSTKYSAASLATPNTFFPHSYTFLYVSNIQNFWKLLGCCTPCSTCNLTSFFVRRPFLKGCCKVRWQITECDTYLEEKFTQSSFRGISKTLPL